VLVGLGAAMISLAPIMVKVLTRQGVGPTPIAVWRSFFASAMLFALARARWGTLALPRRPLQFALLAGLAFAGDLFVWHRSIVLVGAGMATILGNTQVFWTSALGWILYRERLSAAFGVAAIMAFGGVALLAGVGSAIAFDAGYLAGIGFGLGTGLVYGVYILILRQSGRTGDREGDRPAPLPALGQATLVLAWVTAVCGAALFVASAVEGEPLTPPGGEALGWLIALALIVQVLGWLAISSSLPWLPASRGSLMLLIQPASATLLGALLFGESLAGLQIAGACVTLAAVYLGSRS